jgi:membrane-associated phospholipid phosphatase
VGLADAGLGGKASGMLVLPLMTYSDSPNDSNFPDSSCPDSNFPDSDPEGSDLEDRETAGEAIVPSGLMELDSATRRCSLWEVSGVSWPLLRGALVLAMLGLAVAPFDLAVAAWFRSSRLPGDLGKAVHLSEAFAHGAGAATILLAAWLLDERLQGPGGRRCLSWVVIGSYGGGLVTDLIKAMVDRVRPRALDFSAVQSTLGTFASPEGIGGSDLHSFPSGHSAVAAGLGCTLALLYPRGRWLFGVLAVLACCQRLVASAHYPSDAVFGATIGLVVATLAARRPSIPCPAGSCESRPSASLKDC